jgi:hypothetical protein
VHTVAIDALPVAADVVALIGIALLVAVLLTVFVLARMAWRFFRGEEQMDPGGSWGRQVSGHRESENDLGDRTH